MSFKEITINEFNENPVTLIANEWMLVSAGTKEKLNTMTASWGGIGEMWGKPVAITVIRPQRYTNEFIDKNDYFSLSFYGKSKESREIHKICGNKSGRDIDKIKETGLIPIYDNNTVYFEQARLVFICKKIFKQQINPEGIIDESINKWYNNDYHIAYVGEIVKILVND